MVNFAVTTNVNLQQGITSGGFGYVSASGSVIVPTATTIYVNEGGTLTVAGSVMAGGSGYGATFYGSGDGLVNVSASGVIVGSVGVGLNSVGFSFRLNNAGMISGRNEGLNILSSGAIFMNSGDIFGNNYSGIHITVGDTSYISNAGRISGAAIGYFQEGPGNTAMNNSGRIFGSTDAIVTAGGADSITNTGELSGFVILGDGNDTLLGGHGLQEAVYGGAGADSIVGGAAGELLDGGIDNDVLRGNGADDRLYGQAGNDSVWGGADDDALDGGAGTDFLYGGSGDDALTGGADADRLYGGWGDDALNGGAGADVFVFAPGHGNDRIYGFADNVDKMDLRSFDIASLTALKTHASNSALGLRIDLHDFDGGSIILAGMTYAKLTAADVLL